MLQPIGLIHGHTEVRALRDTIPALQELLDFEVVDARAGQTILRHPRTNWPLIMHERSSSPDKSRLNHYGVRVISNAEVDKAWTYIEANRRRLKLGPVSTPTFLHHSYCFTFVEPGGNFWEVESYERAVSKGRKGIARGHWREPLGPEHADGRGYVPQAFTHGTLECDEKARAERFYTDVLGLDISLSAKPAIYVKHPDTPWYVVVLQCEERHYLNRNMAFTIALRSADEVRAAHRWFTADGPELGLTGLQPLQHSGAAASFLVSDPDHNWWEITTPPNAATYIASGQG